MTVSFLRKCETVCDYAHTGIRFGADLRSKWLLASMLVRLKWRGAESGAQTLYQMQVQIGPLRRALSIRASDIFLVHEVLSQSIYTHPEMAQEPPRCIVDLGAHIGLATLRFKASFPDAEVHCYEPDPENFALLRSNTAGLPKVVLHQEAVGVQRTEALLYIPNGRHSASSLRRLPGAEHVREVVCQVKPLDEILAEVGRPVDLVKFDIEGVEYEVFAASRLVHQVRWIVGELKARPPEVERFLTLFPSHNARLHWQTPKMAYIYLKRKG